MRKWLYLLPILVSALVAGTVGFGISQLNSGKINVFEPELTPIPTPLAKYEIEKLSGKEVPKGEIEIKEALFKDEKYTSFKFEHKFDPTLENKDIKTVTGQVNIPSEGESFPLVLMLRGYVDPSLYETGIGTRSGAKFFAENGFITLAPDFLGYGDSNQEAADVFETRFQTYTTVLSILNSLESIKEWNQKDVFIWAHSNGGQVALTVLTITGQKIPTTLWAPVTKPFPYSILYYTDESLDGGKFIRKELAQFEELYDVNKFSFINYLDKITAPLQLHQGGADDAIPVDWSNSFVARMRKLEKEIEYFYYPESEHNMRPDWDLVIERDLEFFNSRIENP